MGIHKLVIYPRDGHLAPDTGDTVEARLAGLGLIGESFDLDGTRHFLTGPRFLELISLVGCSPYLELDPPDDPAERLSAARAGRFCHVGLRLETRPRLRADGRARPRCPDCGAGTGAAELLAAKGPVDCRRCGVAHPPECWNWREYGGFSNFFIEIWSIYRSEGIPLPPLLRGLEETTGGAWGYFYIQD
jgi:hypothetical protein